MRAEKAEMVKKEALFEQQIQLLKLQLSEAIQREKSSKQMSDPVIEALK